MVLNANNLHLLAIAVLGIDVPDCTICLNLLHHALFNLAPRSDGLSAPLSSTGYGKLDEAKDRARAAELAKKKELEVRLYLAL